MKWNILISYLYTSEADINLFISLHSIDGKYFFWMISINFEQYKEVYLDDDGLF